MGSQVKNPFLTDSDQLQVQVNFFISNLFFLDTEKELLHLFFMDKSLKEFLMNLPIKDFEGLMQYIIENGIEIEGKYINGLGEMINNGKTGKSFDFGIHIPFENEDKGYAFSFQYYPNNKELIFIWVAGNHPGCINTKDYKKLISDNSPESKYITELFQLAVNTVIYMNTFPDCVMEGAPRNVKEEYSKKIGISEKVTEIINSDSRKTPHARRAYFKRLTSEFYTHKKGQTILVRETMVNGKAKTIYTANDIEKMID